MRTRILKEKWFALVLGLLTFPVFGFQVSISWKTSPEAAQYELEISHEGRRIAQEMIPSIKNQWSGDLPAGSYAYRLRGLDAAGREGAWGSRKTFLVAPPAPELLEPPDQSVVMPSSSSDGTTLKWESIKDVKKYLVEVRRDGKETLRKLVPTAETDLSSLENGKYEWRITPLWQLPADIGTERNVLQGKPSQYRKFAIESGTRKVASVDGQLEGTIANPRRVNVSAGIHLGTSFMLPMLQIQYAPSNRFSFGLIGYYVTTVGLSPKNTAMGGLLTASYYLNQAPFSGFSLQQGVGVLSLSLDDESSSVSVRPLFLATTVNWQKNFASGWNFLIGLGAQYVFPHGESRITHSGLLPYSALQVGFAF